MKYLVAFSCGHEETVELFGPTKDRNRKIDYYKNYGLCSACYKAKKNSREENDFAEAEKMFGTLPKLRGTAKQIAWAESLRRKMAVFAYKYIRDHGGMDAMMTKFMKWMFEDEAHTDAKFWIDNRYDMESLDFLRRNAREYL
jgi:hypothetical protein